MRHKPSTTIREPHLHLSSSQGTLSGYCAVTSKPRVLRTSLTIASWGHFPLWHAKAGPPTTSAYPTHCPVCTPFLMYLCLNPTTVHWTRLCLLASFWMATQLQRLRKSSTRARWGIVTNIYCLGRTYLHLRTLGCPIRTFPQP